MKKRLSVVIFLFSMVSSDIMGQLLSLSPQFPSESSTVTITVDAAFGNKGLAGATPSDVYVHTGVITNLSSSPTSWRYVKFNQNFNQANPALQATSLGNNRWQFTITDIRSYFGVPAGEQIRKVAILFRNGSGNRVQRNADGSDMYITVYPTGLQMSITEPWKQPTFIPAPEPATRQVGQTISIKAAASQPANLRLFFNELEVAAAPGSTDISASATITKPGLQVIIALAEAVSGTTTAADTIEFFVNPATEVAALPAGVKDGANYSEDQTSVTLVLYAPNKNNVAVIGDFNDWKPTVEHMMKRTPDGLRYWVTIGGLTPGQEYGYQYLIDGQLKVADYRTEKVLDPWNDPWINTDFPDRYPNLKPYPTGKTSGIVSVLEPGKTAYNWSGATTKFQRPDKRNLMVYELLLRDFLVKNDWKTLRDTLAYLSRLGVNALHLMPFNEFEGNNSWGYNPSFMFAVDKFYGPENTLREFIDSCHGRGIAVIMDMVLNHQFGSSPMVQMYWDAANSRPSNQNPWFNPVAKHGFNVGYDMNHESPATAQLVEDVMRHWLVQYRLDGFRWDLSKGFTQTQTCDNNGNNCDVGGWGRYDQSRVNIWQRIYNQSQSISPNAYMILEHLGDDDEEATLANMGMLLWGKMTDQFNQASMGYSSNADFSRAYHGARWGSFAAANKPHLMAYAESHDEERLMWKNVQFGNSGPNHNTRLLSTSSRRMQAVAGFLFTVPGPKLMWQFGELGYDSSINMCNTLQNSGCRTDPKPTAWAMPAGANTTPGLPYSGPVQNYNTNVFRRSLRDTYGRMISLRTRYPVVQEAFLNGDFQYSLSGTFKWQRLTSSNFNLLTIGNFDVIRVEDPLGSVTFPAAGTWYVYAHNIVSSGPGDPFAAVNPLLTSTSIQISPGQLTQKFYLPAGAFLVFTDREVSSLVSQFTFTGNGNWSDAANWANGQKPPAVLQAGYQIFINPAENGSCILDVSQILQPGATLRVNPGGKFIINGNLEQQ